MAVGNQTPKDPGRRKFIALSAAGVGLLAFGWGQPKARAATAESKALLDKLTLSGKAKTGRVTLRLPEIAENGNTVPISVSVDSPMTDADHVKSISVVADGNPNPKVARVHLGPGAGKADVQLRIRLAQTQNIIAVAEMSDGSLWMATREIKVTIGGCGG